MLYQEALGARFKAFDLGPVNAGITMVASDAMSLRVGQKAPEFEVVASSGAKVKLSDFRGKKNVVLYFYPGDFTPICTKETCGFRDMYADLASKDTVVVGISTDSDSSHERFIAEYKLEFPLVSDASRELAKTYGATGFLRNLLGKTARMTFVIDKNGDIAGIFQGEFSASAHLDGVRQLVAKLSA